MGETIRSYKASFNGGELTPEFFGQIGDAKFQTGLATCRNFVVKPQGPIENRAGLAFVREVKNSAQAVRLLPFTFSTTQTMILEMGPGYFRFHTQGATVLNAGVPYEIATPYAEADLFSIHTTQSGDILTLVHPNYPPMELRRLGATNWTLSPIVFTPTIQPPVNPYVVPHQDPPPAGAISMSYVIATLSADGLTQSVPTAEFSCVNNIFAAGAYNIVHWTEPPGATPGVTQYIIFKKVGGSYGYIGRTTGVRLVDDNIAADLSVTPAMYDTVFQAAGDYPAATSYYEQRRAFAGTTNAPQKIWMTRSGTESDMSYSLPTRDDDRIAFRIAALQANTIRHLVPLSDLLVLTSSAEFRITSVNTDALTPSSISVKPQSYIGASNVQPVIINSNLLYGAARGGHMREMSYSRDANGYASGDLSLRSIHLFDDFELVDMAYAKAPMPIVWAVSSSGKLLGLTYVPEQQVGGWHQHDTDGVFESCAVVAEGREDVLYVVVRRTIGGVQKRYVERLASRRFVDPADGFFVDSGSTYRGAPSTLISGLTWLEGKTVSILANGAVHPQRVVTNGQVVLDNPASVVHVGLPITADARTLPLAAQIDAGYGQGRVKNVNKVWMRVVRSSGIFAGPSAERLVQFKQRTTEPYGTPPTLRTDEIEIDVRPDWGNDAAITIRQTDPLPITITSMTMEVVIAN
jgi:hypothetical protein